jgi:hypothetical protein
LTLNHTIFQYPAALVQTAFVKVHIHSSLRGWIGDFDYLTLVNKQTHEEAS